MTTVPVPIGPAGPLVDVELTLPAAALLTLRAAGTPIPPPVAAVALIDTGADVTVLDPAVLAPLVAAGLQVSRAFLVNAPAAGGLAPALEYRVGLTVAPVAGRGPGWPCGRSRWSSGNSARSGIRRSSAGTSSTW